MSDAASGRAVMEAIKNHAKSGPGGSINELRVVVALERAVARLESQFNPIDAFDLQGRIRSAKDYRHTAFYT